MDSGNETEIQADDVQPVDAVVADTEITEDTPQSEGTEQTEVYIDDEEGDQEKPKSAMSQEQAHAAWLKEKEKRKRKNEQLIQEQKSREKIEKELADLKSQVGEITRGEMPDPFDFEDKHEYYKALKEWEGQKPEVNPPEPSQDAVNNTENDEAEFYLYQREQELTKALPEYTEAKIKLANVMKEKYNVAEPDKVFATFANIAKQSGVDVAKSFLAMEKVPSILDELNTTSNPFEISRILEKAASKVKTRSIKPIDTRPEPEVTNSGVVVGGKEAARKRWVENPSAANYKAYQQSKKVN